LFGFLISWAIIVWTFVNGLEITVLPAKERGLTIGAPIFGHGTITLAELKKLVTDFAAKLCAFLTIVKIKIIGWGLTTWASGCGRHFQARPTMMDRRERITVFAFKRREQVFPI
jgi:hypothetical protein